MSMIEPFSGMTAGGLSRRDARTVQRSRSGSVVSRLAREAAIDSETDVALSKLDSFTLTTASGMNHVAKIAQAEQALTEMAPRAAGRIRFLADQHTMGVVAELNAFQTKLRRI
jgi:hypothetical protein